MPAHAQLVTATTAGNGGSPSAGGRLHTPTPRLRAIPSTVPGVADVPRTLEGQKRFYELHDRILGLGARAVGTADDMEEDLKRTERLLELQAAEQSTKENGDGEDSVDNTTMQDDQQVLPPSSRSNSQASSTGRNSELEVEQYLLTNRLEKPETIRGNGPFDFELYGLDQKEFVNLPAEVNELQNADASPAEADQAGCEMSELEDEGPPMDEDDEQVGQDRETTPRYADDGDNVTLRAKRGPGALMSPPEQGGTSSRSEHQGEQNAAPSGPLEIVRLLDFWRENVSRLHLPHVWYRRQPASTDLTASESSLYGSKLTLVMPDGTKRAFETTVSYSNKLAACIDAFSQAWVSNVHIQAARMREQVGWEAEDREIAEGKERMKAMPGGEKPYEALRAEQERWMAPPMNATFEKDDLNSVHGCTLSISVDRASTPRIFTTAVVYASPREARAEAARLALEADIPAAYERGFQDLLKRDQGGYIQFGDFSAADAAVLGDLQQDEEAPNSDEEETLDAEGSVRKEVRAAFGHAGRWMKWTYPHAEKVGEVNAGPPILGTTLTIDFPVTLECPDPPSPFTVSTPLKYRTKRHARLACCSTAISDGLFDRLEPYKEERRKEEARKEEDKKRREEQRRKDREAGINWETPLVGTVKYEELESIRNPAGYLNVCAQQWTGNGSPLKFEYTTETVENSNIKYYGCTLTVFVNISLSKPYVVAPSPELATHAVAKEAAVRLALREHVLELLMPADFDPAAPILTAAAAARLARAARGMEALEQETAAAGTRTEGAGVPSEAAVLVQPRDAVAELDAFVQDWVGQGCLPSYDIHYDPNTGLWGGTLTIPFAQDIIPEDSSDPNSPLVPCWSRIFSCRNASLTRRRAEQRLAQDALDERIIEFMRDEVPPRSKNAPPFECHECGIATGGKRSHAEMDDTAGTTGSEAQEGVSADKSPRHQTPRKKLKRDLADIGVELVGQEGGEVDRLQRGCRSILGLDLVTGPRYELCETDEQHEATVLVPIDAQGVESRRFICDEPQESADLAAEAAAKSALDAGILDLIESRVRPKARPAPAASADTAASPEKDIRTAQKGIALPAAVPKHGEELAAIRRATYGGFGMATASQLEAITKKLEQELRDEQAREDAKRAAEREAEERKRLGNPLLPGVPTTAEALLAAQQPGEEVQQHAPSALSKLQAYCDRRSIAFPEIHVEPSTETASGGSPRVRVWLILLGLKYELRKAKASSARERLAAQVLEHLTKAKEREFHGGKHRDCA